MGVLDTVGGHLLGIVWCSVESDIVGLRVRFSTAASIGRSAVPLFFFTLLHFLLHGSYLFVFCFGV